MLFSPVPTRCLQENPLLNDTEIHQERRLLCSSSDFIRVEASVNVTVSISANKEVTPGQSDNGSEAEVYRLHSTAIKEKL